MEDILYLLQKHPDWLWTNPALYAVSILFMGLKAVLKLATYLESSAEFKNEWSSASVPLCSWHAQGQICLFLQIHLGV
jgi:hypothetical protein